MDVTTLSEINGIKTTSGNITGKKYPALRSSRIRSNSERALSGSWRHVRRALANDKLYSDRLKSIIEWFDVWDSSQRCKFFLTLLRKCTKSELAFVEGWFIQRSPILRQDFTTVLPRWISLYIFSFLDPKSLCRAAQVNWHWHVLAEQDAVWMPKCIRLGWLLPVFPNAKEYGAWKYHYIKCVKSLDFNVSAYNVRRFTRIRNTIPEDNIVIRRENDYDDFDESDEEMVDFSDSNIVHEQVPRPPWQNSTKSPRILEKEYIGMLGNTQRNEKKYDRNNNKTNKHQRSKSVPTTLTKSIRSKSGLPLSARDGGIDLNKSSSLELSLNNKSFKDLSMSQRTATLDDYTMDRRKLKSSTGSLYTTRRSLESKSFQSITADEPIIRHDFAYEHPVVLFISSRMPAKEILLDCARFGTIMIPYDFEGTTLDGLILSLKLRLAGRHAKRIGFCVDGDASQGTARIISGATLSVASLKHPNMQDFWKEVSVHIVDSKDSRVDIFWPLASTENGLDVLEDLSQTTGVQFSSPAGITGSLTRMETEWFKEDGKQRTELKYFKQERIMTWVNYCDYLEETMISIRKILREHLNEEHSGLTNRMIGELAGKLLRVADIAEVKKLCSALNSVCEQDSTLLSDEEQSKRLQTLTDLISEAKTAQIKDDDSAFEIPKDAGSLQIEDRTHCASVIYQMEEEYKEKLQTFKNIYARPLASSIQSNRAIASSNSVKMIFSDCELLQKTSSELVTDLKKRIDSWNSEQCLGDVYLTFSSTLKAYSNFLKNYPTILKTIERCVEENPAFRAFIHRQKTSIESGYLSIQEFLVLPTQINRRRADLLSTLIKCTPSEHKDRQFIVKALKKLREISDNFKQVEERIEKEKQFEELKIRIKGCPALSQQGRYFLKEMELSELSARKQQPASDYAVTYLHIQNITIFLFNDILICARRYLHLQAFKRSFRQELRFDFAIDPRQIRVVDVSDSKHFNNAFTISFPERDWLLQAKNKEDKMSYMSLLSEISASALPDSCKLLSKR